jgi:hypothetical protein
MRVQPKLHEIIFYYNESELLMKRMEHCSNKVSNLFIVNFGYELINFEDPNISVINGVKNIEDFFGSDNIESFIRLLVDNKVRIEDILVFSKTNEIPDYELILINYKELNKGPHLLKQKQFFWNHEYVSETSHYGTKVMLLSHILKRNKIVLDLQELHYPVFLGENILEGGFLLNGFGDYQNFLDSFIFWNDIKTNKQLLSEKFDASKKLLREFWLKKHPKKIFKETKSELPRIFHDYKNKIRPKQKNLCINFGDKFVDSNLYDFVLQVSESEIEVLNHKKFSIIIPKRDWYSSSNSFSDDFLKNELLFVLKTLELQDQDKIIVIKKTDESPSVCTYKKFKSIIPSKVF